MLTLKEEELDDLAQEPADETDYRFRCIRTRVACFLPLELVGELYEMGAHRTIAEVAPQLFASVLALSLHTPMYANVLDRVQASFTKVVWKNHPTLSYIEGTIWNSRSWVLS